MFVKTSKSTLSIARRSVAPTLLLGFSVVFVVILMLSFCLREPRPEGF